MGFPDSTFRSLDVELAPPPGTAWHHALAVVLAGAAISIGWLIGG